MIRASRPSGGRRGEGDLVPIVWVRDGKRKRIQARESSEGSA